MTPHPTTPICPVCGAKHSHDRATSSCRKCGVPDEILLMGPRMIARWKRQHAKEARARGERQKVVIGGSAGRKRNKHGRKGVKA
jgi:hypothetical protein